MTEHRLPHPVRLVAPFYGRAGQSGLHRYLDPDFINRFRQHVLRRQFDQAQFSAWIAEDSPQGAAEPVLRLPLHKTFHVFCCEIVCDRLGLPALDPDRIRSAGFVIRRVGADREQAWMVEDGVALGWQDAATEQRDPDHYRCLCASGVLRRLPDPIAYSGEETHPLHVLNANDAQGRRHTLLFGYLPLGGSAYVQGRSLDGLDAATPQEKIVDFLRPGPSLKFGGGDADLFQIVPFVRAADGDGCERLQWASDGARSTHFRVATPFDPRASRPTLVQRTAMADINGGPWG